MSQLPYTGIRIIESGGTLSARLVGLLFADQGAQVQCLHRIDRAGQEVDEYLDRGKQVVAPEALIDTSDADVVIVDGNAAVPRPTSQIVLRITAAMPGDELFGQLPANCCEDLLSATLGFFTDMALTGPAIGRPVIYTPLPVSSVYTGVNGAVAVAAALARRVRTGSGCEITASRLAGGLSAIGALAVTNEGLPPHLAPAPRVSVPRGMTPKQFSAILSEAAESEERRSWLEHRMIPFGVPYRAADGRMVMLINGVNRLATRKLYKALGIWDRLIAAGLVDISPYAPQSLAVRGRNLADSPTLDFASASLVAELFEEIIATKPAADWERELCGLGVASAKVMSLQEWLQDVEARRAGLTAQVVGTDRPQLGRAAWLASAQPYPPIGATSDHNPGDATTTASLPPDGGAVVNPALPLEGRVVVDLTNVIAGPNCARMLGELGAEVYRVEQPEPSHPPIAMTIWGAEAGAGKQSIILDIQKPEGRAVLRGLLSRADFVVANKSDAQCQHLGIDVQSLHALNPKAILVQLTAHHGERAGARHDYPGYDPTGQAITGIMTRFGTARCPTYHGLASCVDYLTGYLGVWAAVSALYARERRGDGRGDWAQTSLTAAASLMQFLFQFAEPPASACGPHAVGPTPGRRTYRVDDGWLFACGDTDLSTLLQGQSVASALDMLAQQGIDATRINTVRELADRHRASPTRTIHFQSLERDGWSTGCFVPTWFCFDGAVAETRQTAVRIGSSADTVLNSLGLSSQAIEQLKTTGVVGRPEWARPNDVS